MIVFTSGFWKSRGRRQTQGYTNPKTEATLRAALAEPAAPGEEESYHRLMTVIADDLRLRQPVHHRNWAWLPTTSVALAGMILAFIAYDAGVQHGTDVTSKLYAQVSRPEAPAPSESRVPRGMYYPSADRPANTARPPVTVKEIPLPAPKTDGIVLAWVPMDVLSKDQQEMLRQVEARESARDWDGAAVKLVQLADMDPSSDVAINAVYEAARVREDRVKDAAGALELYKRAELMCQEQLDKTTDQDRFRQINDWRGLAQLGIKRTSGEAPAEEGATP